MGDEHGEKLDATRELVVLAESGVELLTKALLAEVRRREDTVKDLTEATRQMSEALDPPEEGGPAESDIPPNS